MSWNQFDAHVAPTLRIRAAKLGEGVVPPQLRSSSFINTSLHETFLIFHSHSHSRSGTVFRTHVVRTLILSVSNYCSTKTKRSKESELAKDYINVCKAANADSYLKSVSCRRRLHSNHLILHLLNPLHRRCRRQIFCG